MTNLSKLKLTGLLIVILGVTVFPTSMLRSKAQQLSQDTIAKRRELVERKLAQDRRQQELDRARNNFKKTKELLIKKGVPFDPDILMTLNWRQRLSSHFEAMPELQEVKIGPGKLKGVQLAHTLYLPRKVQLVGDTVILARNLVFEGREAVIRGPFSVYVYPIDRVGLLGSTLDQAVKKSDVRFLYASFRHPAANSPPNLPLIAGGSLTIDTSGGGYKEWLKERGLSEVRGRVFVQAAFRPQDANNTSGATGKPGKNADPGANGSPISALGLTGEDGTCGGVFSVNGKEGGIGLPGNPGLRPTENGGTGERGVDASPISISIPDDSTASYFLRAEGGDGGPGGWGGQGGSGSDGGRGGPGGTGANCSCDQGGSGFGGNGGRGGPAGSAGPGSDGGKGGNGGDGKDITVSYPSSYDESNIQAFAAGGRPGQPGSPGPPGLPGAPGKGGPPGMSGGATNCSNAGWGGETGQTGTPAAEGAWGGLGSFGDKEGLSGTINKNMRPQSGTCSEQQALDCINSLGRWVEETCYCDHSIGPHTPIVIDIEGNGFSLTSAAEGVYFDLNADGAAEHLSWTAQASDDAFLALDLNENGMIDSGAELFGNDTPQPPSPSPNGFTALAQFDREENGGNGNGIIDAGDAVYVRLLLWPDTNHNGKSDPAELRPLAQSGLKAISLDYQRSNRRDEYGNRFFYRSKIQVAKGSSAEHWAYDIFLVLGS